MTSSLAFLTDVRQILILSGFLMGRQSIEYFRLLAKPVQIDFAGFPLEETEFIEMLDCD